MRSALLLLPVLLLAGEAAEWPDFIPPRDSGVVNVRDYGAVGDGTTDDTEAIRTAISENIDRSRYAAPPMIWLPAGTYLVSAPIEGRQYKDLKGWSHGWRAGFLLVGQARAKTVIRLKDSCDGYGDPAKPRYVVATGSEHHGGGANAAGGGNQAFRHCIANLTVDVGAGNPGAIGIDFIANNRGTVENVRIRAAAGSGHKGLAMDRHWPGPALVKRVAIEGFDTGISMAGHWQYSMTFEDIVLKDQRKLGLWSEHNPVFMRRLSASGPAPAIRIKDNDGLLVLLDSTVAGNGGDGAGIRVEGIADIRNLTSTGWRMAIDGAGGNDVAAVDPAKPTVVKAWRQGHQAAAGGGAPAALNLPIEETPLWWPRAETDWANGAGDVQKALDSGAPVVYLPNGGHEVPATLVVKGTTRKLVGFQSVLKAKPGVSPLLRIEGKASLIIEHIWLEGVVEHVGTGTLTLRHCDLAEPKGGRGGLVASGTGWTFIEDVIGNIAIGAGHRLWARQINAEFGDRALHRNDGGTLWFFGYKTEADPGTVSLHQVGGASEILGAILYPLRDMRQDTPAWIVEGGGRFSGSWVYNNKWYSTHVRHDGTALTGNWGRGPALWSTEGVAKP